MFIRKDSGMRATIQRQIIMDTLARLHQHATAEEIYQAIHAQHPTISKATVYRNLQAFAQQGDLVSLQIEGDATRYDHRLALHYHFVCKQCDAIFDVDITPVEHINQNVQEQYGFEVDTHEIVFRGICPACAANQNKHSNT